MSNYYDLYRIPAQDMKKVATGLILHYEEAQDENPMTDFLRLTRNILIAILLSWLGFSISPSETPEFAGTATIANRHSALALHASGGCPPRLNLASGLLIQSLAPGLFA